MLIFALIVLSFVLVQCTKENTTNLKSDTIELRDDSACNPEDIFTDNTDCKMKLETKTISFKKGPKLSDFDFLLTKICPDLQVTVTYFKTVCHNKYGKEVTYLSGLKYDLQDLFDSCPELRHKVAYDKYINGSATDILDQIDNEISNQLSYETGYEKVAKDHIDCAEKTYNLNYIKNTCYKWEWVGILSGPEDNGFTIAKVDCGSSVCCVTENYYCANFYPDGTIKEFTYTLGNVIDFEGECDDNCTHDCIVSENTSNSPVEEIGM